MTFEFFSLGFRKYVDFLFCKEFETLEKETLN